MATAARGIGLALAVLGLASGWAYLNLDSGGTPATSTWVVDVNGQDAHRVGPGDSPSFAPDGRLLGSDSEGNLIKIAAGYEPHIDTGGDAAQPAISPTGRIVAYTAYWPDQYSELSLGIALIPATGGTGRPLTHYGSDPAWSPNGRWIAFTTTPPSDTLAGGSRSPGIWMIGVDGTDLHLLIKIDDPIDANPTFDPSGQRIAFAMRGDIYTINTNGNQLRQLTHTGHNQQPAWAPSGGHIAFIHACHGIWLVNPNGSDVTPIAHTNGATDPTWAPNSARLAYERYGPTGCPA